MSTKKRRQMFIDRRVQGALALRVAGYYGLLLFSVFCILYIVPGIYYLVLPSSNSPSLTQSLWQSFLDFWPIAAASALILPLVVQDLVHKSNQFAGPVYRIRDTMGKLAAGESVEHVHFRDGDFWPELADQLNSIIDRLDAAESRVAELEGRSLDKEEPVQV